MSDREQDKRVAEILGYIVVDEHWMRPIDHPDNFRFERRLPNYTTDPAADYKVLEWLRGKYSEDDFVGGMFLSELDDIWCAESRGIWGGDPLAYQPGDYSRALLALDEQRLLK